MTFPSTFQTKNHYNVYLVEKLIKIITLSCQTGSRVRLATVEMSILFLKQLVYRKGKNFLQDRHLACIEGAKEESVLLLRVFYKVCMYRGWEFSGNTRKSRFFQRFPGFSRVGVPHLRKKNNNLFFFGENSFYPPCNSATPKALKLHLQSIKLILWIFVHLRARWCCDSQNVRVFWFRPFSSLMYVLGPIRCRAWPQRFLQEFKTPEQTKQKIFSGSSTMSSGHVIEAFWPKCTFYSGIIQSTRLTLLGLMATSVTKGGTQKLPKIFKIIEIYWYDHSLESSWALEHFLMVPFIFRFGEKYIFWIFSNNLSP
jgi:hypothetical protein